MRSAPLFLIVKKAVTVGLAHYREIVAVRRTDKTIAQYINNTAVYDVYEVGRKLEPNNAQQTH